MKVFLKLIFIGLGVVFASQFFSCSPKKSTNTEEIVQDTIVEVIELELKYGLPVDSFSIETGKVKNNQYLSQILNAKGVGMGTIDKIARKSRDIFDVRKIRYGKNYSIFSTRDSVPQAKYFV